MNRSACEEKVRELSARVADLLVDEAMRLYSSGGVSTSDYEDQEYRLPKLLVSAALKEAEFQCRPLNDADLLVLKNLRHF